MLIVIIWTIVSQTKLTILATVDWLTSLAKQFITVTLSVHRSAQNDVHYAALSTGPSAIDSWYMLKVTTLLTTAQSLVAQLIHASITEATFSIQMLIIATNWPATTSLSHMIRTRCFDNTVYFYWSLNVLLYQYATSTRCTQHGTKIGNQIKLMSTTICRDWSHQYQYW